ncbi:MAG TPA: S41 family peptidase [Candidatus Dormibacteraeota bacterium]|nr:S41 family peptidase [Candidatus Dormibacteraeota bacterium]
MSFEPWPPTPTDAVGSEPLPGAPGEPPLDPSDGLPYSSVDPEPEPAPAPRASRRRAAVRAARRTLTGLGVVVLAVALFGAGVGADRSGMLGGPAAAPAPNDPTQFALVRQAWDLLRTQYVGAKDVDPTKMAYGAIGGMTQAVGDVGHTAFLTPADRKANQAELSGTYVGIGVELDIKDGMPVINGIIHGGPSESAGLLPGDVITAVDGNDTQDQPLETIASEVRGTVGTTVVLKIQRPNVQQPLTFRIVRREITVPPVDSAMVPGTTLAMIRVEQFSTGAGDQFTTQLKALMANHPTGLILDLRGNPGGYVSEAVNVASQFLTSGDVYITRDASGKETPSPVKAGAVAPSIPLVVLVDAGTASSAEIVAGALKDAGRGQLIGATTFGTGTVVAEYPLADGSALRIGTVEWLTPKREPIWRHGITPDVPVELQQGVRPVTPDQLAGLGPSGVESTKDAQLAKAISLLTKR